MEYEHVLEPLFQQMLRDYVESLDDSVRPCRMDLLRDVVWNFRERGFYVNGNDVSRTFATAMRQLMPAVVEHVTGFREMEPLDKKVATILEMDTCIDTPYISDADYYINQEYFHVYTPHTEQRPWLTKVHKRGIPFENVIFLKKPT